MEISDIPVEHWPYWFLLILTLAIALLSGFAGYGKYVYSPKPVSIRYIIGSFIIHMITGVMTSTFVGFVWTVYYKGNIVSVEYILLAIFSSLVMVKIGNGNITKLIISLINKYAKVKLEVSPFDEMVERYSLELSPEDIKEALESKIAWKKAAELYKANIIDKLPEFSGIRLGKKTTGKVLEELIELDADQNHSGDIKDLDTEATGEFNLQDILEAIKPDNPDNKSTNVK